MSVANQTPASVATEYTTLKFIIQQLMRGMATATLVKVKACSNNGGLTRVGTVDVQLLVDQITEDGQTIPQGVVFNAPYQRMQGGTDAIILDPKPGDIGLCVFAMRDISAVKAEPDAARDRAPVPGAPPGSRRVYSLSDALYVGGMLNGEPTQYIQFNTDGITIVSPSAITLQAPTINLKGTVVQTDGDVSMSGDLTVAGTVHGAVDVIADTISGKSHTHTSESPGDPTSPPL